MELSQALTPFIVFNGCQASQLMVRHLRRGDKNFYVVRRQLLKKGTKPYYVCEIFGTKFCSISLEQILKDIENVYPCKNYKYYGNNTVTA